MTLAAFVSARIAGGLDATRRGTDLLLAATVGSLIVEGPGLDAVPDPGGRPSTAPDPRRRRMTTFDPMSIRDQFPALALEQDGRPVVYLDGPGGTQVPQRVIDAVVGYYRTMNANDGGAFQTSEATMAMVAGARAAVADLLGATDPDQVHFGANMTTLTFHVSRSIGATLGAGDEIVVTTLDHEANVSPWRALASRSRPGRPDGGYPRRGRHARPGSAGRACSGRGHGWSRWAWRPTPWAPSTRCSRIAEMAHAHGALVFMDAVHYVPHHGVDVATLGADLLVTSPYKWFGPHSGSAVGG